MPFGYLYRKMLVTKYDALFIASENVRNVAKKGKTLGFASYISLL